MDLNILVTPVMCGVIGYITNLIAIKMLFVPRYEKRIFGKKLPFTPGLLPKNKSKMAESLGDTVGNYLLTEDAVQESLLKSGINENIEQYIEEFLEKAQSNQMTLREAVEKLSGSDTLLNDFESYITNEILNYIQTNKDTLIKKLCKELKSYLQKINTIDYSFKAIALFSEAMKNKTREFMETEEFIQLCEKLISYVLNAVDEKDIPLNEIISLDAVHTIKSGAFRLIPKASSLMAQYLDQNEELNKNLSDIVLKVVSDSAGSFIASLVYKKVYSSIKESALAYLTNADNYHASYDRLEELLEQILLKTPQELKNLFSEEKTAEWLKNILLSLFTKENVEKGIDFIKVHAENGISKADYSLYDLLLKISPEIDQKLYETFLSVYENTVKGQLQDKITEISHAGLDKLFDLTIGELFLMLGPNNIVKFKNIILTNKDALIKKGITTISEKLEVKTIVEQKINEFSVEQVEELVLNLAKKELNYITCLGGVLGFLMGFVSLIIK